MILDIATGRTIALDRGPYQCKTTPFPIAFLDDAVIVATDWNRLDLFDMASGHLSSNRDTAWQRECPRPEHYLDYFHGRLLLNPSGGSLADDGWIWSPVGAPSVIDVEGWRRGDTYAAEHGEALSYRSYAWDQPIAWIDDTTIAIQRIGHDDEAMLDGVEIYDAPSGRRIAIFAGPNGRMWAYRGKLHVAASTGMEIWNRETGARISHLTDFRPTAHDPVTGAFAELRENRLRTWRPDQPS
ncbi:hypothetical protein [Fodinicola feengrottensis]|uniref:hypothetical protein n=1 Tax=Fodinicola feengrottensis TaxID=435914 RepID=UPI0031CFA48E